jgi:hypothetical protein
LSAGTKPTEKKSIVIRDVKLVDEGVLAGQLLGQSGNPIADETVFLADSKQVIATTKTCEDGTFKLRGIQSGSYGIGSHQTSSLVRVWSPGTAPPAASKEILLVVTGQTVRSQMGGINDGMFRYDEALGILGIPLLLITAATIVQQAS